MFLSPLTTFLAGALTGTSFAPLHIFPAIIGLSILLRKITYAKSLKEAFKQGYIFGFGLFLALLYWIAIGVSVYADKFWWAIPFALFGLPMIMATFPALTSACTYRIKNTNHLHFGFCITWIFFEWISSWIFTGLPWGLLGYSFSFSLTILQSASIFGVYGLSFIAVYVGSMFYMRNNLAMRSITAVAVLCIIVMFGYNRLESNPTKYSDHTIRIVQPSIAQTDKWIADEMFKNIDKHIELSIKPFRLSNSPPDIIVWSEAALTIPYYYPPILEKLLMMLENESQVLISGGITDNGLRDENMEIYSSIIALQSSGELDFEYHKSHLVPFGEYIPFGQYLPLHKITPGLHDYTQGNYEIVTLSRQNINIKPQICYEAIFPDEAATNAATVDLILNVTNDSWYGNSSGPFQHFQIARMRAIESALPLVRAANNGISAIIDPIGRVINSSRLNEVTTIDNFLPSKLDNAPTIYAKYKYLSLLILILFVSMLQFLASKILKINTII